jgi:hypothetical protein
MAALLVDEGIGRDLVQALVAQGFTVYHWLDIGSKGASDAEIFLEAQKRDLTIFTHNRQDYELLTHAWRLWGHGDHHGVITGRKGRMQLPPSQLLQVMIHYCADNSVFTNRIETF